MGGALGLQCELCEVDTPPHHSRARCCAVAAEPLTPIVRLGYAAPAALFRGDQARVAQIKTQDSPLRVPAPVNTTWKIRVRLRIIVTVKFIPQNLCVE
eukprot:COSAG03_NODE_1467_length_4028_cov_1.625191_1_plen_98_part_00